MFRARAAHPSRPDNASPVFAREGFGLAANCAIHALLGGWGSGRRGGRLVAEHCLRMDLPRTIRTRRAVPGQHIRSSLFWTRGWELSGSISFEATMSEPGNERLSRRKISAGDRIQDHFKTTSGHICRMYSIEPAYHLGSSDRPAEVVSLHHAYAQQSGDGLLLKRFDPFDRAIQPQLTGQRQDCADNGSRPFALDKVAGETLIDLEVIERQIVNMAQR
jgi:hypothetical protein